MKKICLLIIALLLTLAGCGTKPSDMQMDVYNGNSKDLKLLHVKANDEAKVNQMSGILSAIENAEASDKPMELFAFYPDYTIEISPMGSDEVITVVLDVTSEYVQFYYPGPNPEASDVVYISELSSQEFMDYINTW